ncbi:hypothetical protein GCM10018773_53650 [Streptomyces candidus]|nr:hypothetical protein GCM10018773_53650 [Streptomyces candidus]
MNVTIAQPPGQLAEDAGLTRGQPTSRQPHPGQRPVVRAVQPQGPRARVTTGPQGAPAGPG